MGKCKKRNFNRSRNSEGLSIKREDAVSSILKDIKSGNFSNKTNDLMTLFGIGLEELSEAGASYEAIMALKKLYPFKC